jgi:hypothetical protein
MPPNFRSPGLILSSTQKKETKSLTPLDMPSIGHALHPYRAKSFNVKSMGCLVGGPRMKNIEATFVDNPLGLSI